MSCRWSVQISRDWSRKQRNRYTTNSIRYGWPAILSLKSGTGISAGGTVYQAGPA
ncbi:hypothetical protein DPMN_078206 [Dreissena polymorpha]|uniref:Uncharacterized protein n=1 Tax=Dreissena polymorpha TaxID=45954 RepID=A0A9D3YQP7_DREPO|nr:hypothetical protein DPMN_078206 [Dreissena polymorpha]